MASWYSATARQTSALLFECQHCGARAQVTASATGKGDAMTLPYGLEGAAREAETRAAGAASKAAARMVELAACPRCHARRTSAVVTTAAMQALHLVWLGPVLGGLALFADIMAGDAGAHFTLACALGVLVAIAVVALLVRRKLRVADAAVHFGPLTSR